MKFKILGIYSLLLLGCNSNNQDLVLRFIDYSNNSNKMELDKILSEDFKYITNEKSFEEKSSLINGLDRIKSEKRFVELISIEVGDSTIKTMEKITNNMTSILKTSSIERTMLYEISKGKISKIQLLDIKIPDDYTQKKNAFYSWVKINYYDDFFDLIEKAKKGEDYNDIQNDLLTKFKSKGKAVLDDFIRFEQDIFIDKRDGQKYRTVKICNQIWIAENYKFKIEGSYCYNDEEEYCDMFGSLYTYKSALKACPKGWHLPSYNEWLELENYLKSNGYNGLSTYYGDNNSIGKSISSQNFWAETESKGAIGYDKKSNNKTSFSAVPGGKRDKHGYYDEIGSYKLDHFVTAYWWTSTSIGNNYVKHRSLSYYSSTLASSSSHINDALSVRYIKDK